MSEYAKRRRRSSRRRWTGTTSRRIRAVLALGVVLGLGATSTTAMWTDTSTATSGSFTTGTLDIRLGSPAVDDDPPAFTTEFAMTDMAPGSSDDAVLRVTNAGSLPLGYLVTGTGGGAVDLAAALRLSVYPNGNGGACSGAPLVSNVPVNGQILGSQPSLPPGAVRDLCLRATLPADAPSALQGRSSTVAVTFEATNA